VMMLHQQQQQISALNILIFLELFYMNQMYQKLLMMIRTRKYYVLSDENKSIEFEDILSVEYMFNRKVSNIRATTYTQ
jgi:hypothetical protein